MTLLRITLSRIYPLESLSRGWGAEKGACVACSSKKMRFTPVASIEVAKQDILQYRVLKALTLPKDIEPVGGCEHVQLSEVPWELSATVGTTDDFSRAPEVFVRKRETHHQSRRHVRRRDSHSQRDRWPP